SEVQNRSSANMFVKLVRPMKVGSPSTGQRLRLMYAANNIGPAKKSRKPTTNGETNSQPWMARWRSIWPILALAIGLLLWSRGAGHAPRRRTLELLRQRLRKRVVELFFERRQQIRRLLLAGPE